MTAVLKKNVTVSPSSHCEAETAEAPDRADAPRTAVVLVDDDDAYREAAAVELDCLGFEVAALADGPSLIEFFAAGKRCDIIVLDWYLQSGSSIDFLSQLRNRGVETPVVFLTGVPATAYECAALDRGALDFVDKLRGLDVLARRIRLIVDSGKKAPATQKETVVCGKLTLRPAVCRAHWNEIDIALTVTEFNIVQLMVANVGEYVTYRSIYDCVHCEGFVAGSGKDGYRTNVRSLIKRIRNKFRSVDVDFAEIENFPAFGYRWRSAPDRVD
jgi:two-component system, OmpR family, response regulator ChvI